MENGTDGYPDCDYGLTPFQLVDMAVLHEDGTGCDYNEYGRLVTNSPCTMKGYKDNEEASLNFYLKDAYGRIWGIVLYGHT